MGVYLSQPASGIAATRALLAHFRTFVRSDCHAMRNPLDQFHDTIDQTEAQRILSRLVLVAINRKAGISDERGKGSRARRRLTNQRAKTIRDLGCRECGQRLGWLSADTAAAMVARNPRLARGLENYKCASVGSRLRGWRKYIIHASGDFNRPYHPQPHYCGIC